MSKVDFAQKICPSGYQIISDEAISYLYKEHPEAYKGFYELVDKEPTGDPNCKNCENNGCSNAGVKNLEGNCTGYIQNDLKKYIK